MYNPTETERHVCTNIVKELLKNDDVLDCEKYVEMIFDTAYSIGADYSEKTLKSIAEIIIKST